MGGGGRSGERRVLKKEAEYSGVAQRLRRRPPPRRAVPPAPGASRARLASRPMEAWLHGHLAALMAWLALPQFGLSTVFVVAFVSATLLPMGSEPAVFGLVKLNPELFWPAVLVATAGNTLGGAVSWWMGRGAEEVVERVRRAPVEHRALAWLRRFGAKACFLSFLPVVGDPLCAVAGWLKFPFWPCALYMAIGKFARYLTMTAALLWVFPGGLPF